MKTIQFLKARYATTILSIVGICALWGFTFSHGGFNVGVDFKSGLSLSVVINENKSSLVDIREDLSSLANGIQVQKAENSQIIIRVPSSDEENFQESMEQKVITQLTQKYGAVEVLSSDFVGAGYSAAMIQNSILLVLGALLVIMAYLWFRFELAYAISAMLSTVHDVLFVIGFIGACQLEVNAATVAAVLTIIGYSLNDTIVIFDRIRENRYVEKRLVIQEIIDLSITQMLSRTIITSLTTLLSIGAIVFLATGSVKLFAIEMVFGIIVGTYSSIFVAGTSLNTCYAYHAKKLTKQSGNKQKKYAKA